MTTVENGDYNFEAFTASWILWPASSRHSVPLQRSVDAALAGYSFYPEAEWIRFGYRPPDNLSLLGAWRDAAGTVFAFLMNSEISAEKAGAKPVVLYVAGAMDAVEVIGDKVTALKSVLLKSERKQIQVRHAEELIKLEKKSPAIARLLSLVGLFTVIVNAFSAYLRKLPVPDFPYLFISLLYKALIAIVHFSALLLLLLTILVGIFYLIKYAVLILRRF